MQFARGPGVDVGAPGQEQGHRFQVVALHGHHQGGLAKLVGGVHGNARIKMTHDFLGIPHGGGIAHVLAQRIIRCREREGQGQGQDQGQGGQIAAGHVGGFLWG